MEVTEDPLYRMVQERSRWFAKEARKHKRLNRALWGFSAALMLLIALGTNFEFKVLELTSAQISSGLAIVLPAVTAYTVLRSPQALWIMEIEFRNRLRDLQTEIEFAFRKDPDFDRSEMQETYLKLMAEANEAWVAIKKRAGGRS